MRLLRFAAFVAVLAALWLRPGQPGEVYKCAFAPGAWRPEDWILAKSPRWDYFGQWVQRPDHIENRTPEGASAKDLLSTRAAQTYTSMVYARKVSGNVTVRATMEFDDRMAPLIVLAPQLGQSAAGQPEYREHWEVVLFDEGVNVWRHLYEQGKPSWLKMAYCNLALAAKTRHVLVAKKQGKVLSVSVAGHTFGCLLESLPDEFHVGLTGCEGLNRFYDFAVEN